MNDRAATRPLDEPLGTPHFRLLSDEKLERIHDASLRVLEEVGVRVLAPEARQVLTSAGCPSNDDDIVKIPRRLVESAIDSAPKRVVVYDREGNEALLLEGRNTYFGSGATALHFLDAETGERRDARMEDVGVACRVADALPNIDFAVNPLVTSATPETPQDALNQREFEAMVSNTTKPLRLLLSNAMALGDILDMAEAVAGGPEAFRQKPFLIPFLSVVTPLVYNVDTMEKLLLAVDRGAPVRCGSGPVAGATGPVTLAGTVAVAIAEILGEVTIAQLRKPGAPVIMGNSPTIIDMKAVKQAGVPEWGLICMALTEMAHYYGLPAQVGCFYDAMAPDQQSALEQMMGAFSSALAGTNLALYTGLLEGGLLFSPEAAVLGDEIIGMVRRIMRGMVVDDESLALDTIRAVGPGGNFLETEHTFRHFRKEQWQPTLLHRSTFDSWVEGGSKLMGQRVKEKTVDIIANHEPKPLPDGVRVEISRIVERRIQSLS